MKLLLDTNALILATEDEAALSQAARLALNQSERVKVVSAVAFWEMAIKVGLGKLKLGMAPDALMAQLVCTGAIQVLGIESRHLRRLAMLPYHHRDPFDRLMIAQALEEDWEVVSKDELWDAYGVKRIW
jgi:PIN domain nuclease of toxin-antitoxin system